MSIENPEQIEDGDTVTIRGDQDCLLQRCCGCGLWHEVMVIRKDGAAVALTWNRINGVPKNYEYTGTDISKPKE